MKLAVVGGAGYVGGFTARALKEHGHNVVVIDNFSSARRDAVEDFSVLEIDILKQEERIAEAFEREKFDAVLHFAALIQMGESMQNPALYFTNNVFGSLNLLEVCRKTGVKAFVFSSSAGVYGNPKTLPIPGERQLGSYSNFNPTGWEYVFDPV